MSDDAAADAAPTPEERVSDFAKAAAAAAEEAIEGLEAKLAALEGRAREAAKDGEAMAQDLMTETEKRVRENPLQAVLTALGIGFILGLIFGVGRGR